MKRVTFRSGWLLALTLGWLVTAGCAARRVEGWRLAAGTGAGGGAEFDAARSRAMAHWEARDSEFEIRAAITDLEETSRLDPSNVEVASLISRAYYLLAEGHAPSDSERLALYQVGTQRGEQAMAIQPEFRRAMARGTAMDDALRSLGREYVPAIYWTAVNLGRWARAKGFMTILRNRRKIQRMIERVTALDSTYFYAAPDRYWGAYYSIAPSIAGGDKDKSRMHFERALAIEPNYIGTRVTYAETYAVGVQNRALFEEQLRLALATPLDVLPGIVPEQRVEQEKARRFLARIDELFSR